MDGTCSMDMNMKNGHELEVICTENGSKKDLLLINMS
jgi:hypothetical protein